MVDSPYLVKPGKRFKLSKIDPDDKGKFRHNEEAEPEVEKNLAAWTTGRRCCTRKRSTGC